MTPGATPCLEGSPTFARFPDWADRAAEAIGRLRRRRVWPDDAGLVALIARLSVESAEIRRIWASGEGTAAGLASPGSDRTAG
ncbi:hypothetical protein ABTX81_39035 [Kitasatospora sp. NPDC097605]|uniref:MmyB family transcriptional regulator n=1 Tax=Kitasatospora sp. NPDC097605 TaxID=3157226 RepID=UPI0033285966